LLESADQKYSVDHQEGSHLAISCNISHNSGGGATTLGGGTAISGGGTPRTGGGTPLRLNLTIG